MNATALDRAAAAALDRPAAATMPLECRRRYHEEVRQVSLGMLGLGSGGRLAAARRHLLAPVLYTLERRRDYFPGAFALATAPLAGPAVARLAAATVELGWTCCAQILDDMIDRPPERETHPPAHDVYGYARTAAAVAVALLSMTLAIGRRRALPRRTRARWLWMGALATARAVSGLRRFRGSLAAERYARRWGWALGKPVEWALLAPLVGRLDPAGVAALRRYARLHGVGEKIRNDVLDYCGGSSDRPARFSDFNARRVTFPVTLLMRQDLDEDARSKLMRHFCRRVRGRRLDLAEGIALLTAHRTFDGCLAAMRANARAAGDALDELEAGSPAAAPLAAFLRRWEREALALAEHDVRAALGGPPFLRVDPS